MHHSSELYIHIYILFIRIKKPMHLLINKCTVGWITPGYELSCYHLDLDFIITPFKKKKCLSPHGTSGCRVLIIKMVHSTITMIV